MEEIWKCWVYTGGRDGNVWVKPVRKMEMLGTYMILMGEIRKCWVYTGGRDGKVGVILVGDCPKLH